LWLSNLSSWDISALWLKDCGIIFLHRPSHQSFYNHIPFLVFCSSLLFGTGMVVPKLAVGRIIVPIRQSFFLVITQSPLLSFGAQRLTLPILKVTDFPFIQDASHPARRYASWKEFQPFFMTFSLNQSFCLSAGVMAVSSLHFGRVPLCTSSGPVDSQHPPVLDQMPVLSWVMIERAVCHFCANTPQLTVRLAGFPCRSFFPS